MKIEQIDFNKYVFQKDGKVWSVRKQSFLKNKKDKDGYVCLHLASKDGKFHTYKLHRILAELYCDIPNGYTTDELEVDHINTLKDDNRIENLKWCTSKENHNNPVTLVHRSESMKNKQSISKIVQQFKNEKLIAEYPSTREVERELGYDHKSISKCCRGISKTAYGYIWKYKK